MNDTCIICYATDENYTDLADISINSLVKTSSPENNYEIHIIYTDAPSVLKLENKYNSKNVKIVLHELKNSQKKEYNTKSLKGWENRITHAAYYRFEIPKLIPNDWCIYLDCDIIIKHDIYNLWNERDDKYLLCAVKDAGNPYKCGKRIFKHPENVFNSGVLLMNLKSIRNTDFDNEWRRIESKYGHCEADQGILNIMFNDSVKILPPKYNFFYLYSRDPLFMGYPASTYSNKMKLEAAKDPYIVHYVGKNGTKAMRQKYGKERYRANIKMHNIQCIKIILMILLFIMAFMVIYKSVATPKSNNYYRCNICNRQ